MGDPAVGERERRGVKDAPFWLFTLGVAVVALLVTGWVVARW